MLIINATQIRQALPMAQAIEAMKSGYAALSEGQAQVPLRSHLEVTDYSGLNLYMPAHLAADDGPEALVVKVVGVYPKNPDQGLPMIHASVLVSDPATGQPLALLEGRSLTAIRTGAGAGAATDLLARPDSRIAAVLGAGVQARTQLEALCTVRSIETAWVYDPNTAQVESFIQEMAGRGPIPNDLRAAPDPKTAIGEADIVTTATTSNTPVFRNDQLKPGVHINSVGSFTPEMAEIPPETVLAARVYVDSREAALAEAGDIIQPIQNGLFSKNHIYAEIGEVVAGTANARQTAQETTFFKSVGVAVQDAAAAHLALENASRLGLGEEVDW